MKRFIFSILIGVASFSLAFSQAAEEDHLLQQANQFYLDGDFQQALDSYMKVYKAGYSSYSLYYDLGNTYYKMGQIPSAILFYERAKLLKPHDEDILFNLELANQRIVDRINPVPQFFLKKWLNSFGHVLNYEQWALLSLGLFVLTLVLIGILYGFRGFRLRRLLFSLTILLFLISGFSLYFAGRESNNIYKSESAILFSPTVTVKSTPDSSGTDLFILHEGTKMEIKDHVGDWVEIRIADGNRGWVPQDAVIMI